MIKRSVLSVLVFTALLGVAYPLVIAGAAQILPRRHVYLAHDMHGNPRYFQPRPSGDDYNAFATAFANRGPNQRSTAAFYKREIAAYRKLNGAPPPMDAVTTSASGVDPDISHANALIQARRIARVRGIPLARVLALVGHGVRANTTKLNAALDR